MHQEAFKNDSMANLAAHIKPGIQRDILAGRNPLSGEALIIPIHRHPCLEEMQIRNLCLESGGHCQTTSY